MAFKKKGGIKDTENSGFGAYDEGRGGGSPKGGIWGGQSGRVGWDNRERAGEVTQGEHREDQPRDAGGRFTYNSVNGKETKYESRGKTVNPLLLGDKGKKSVLIEDVKKEFANKQGSLYNKFKDKWYQKGSEMITKDGRKFKTVISENDIWEIARVSFDVNKGGFTYEDENWKTKTGRRSMAEKAARAEARQKGEETFVKDANGGIAKKAGSTPGQQLSTGIPFQVPVSVLRRLQLSQAFSQGGLAGANAAMAQQPQPGLSAGTAGASNNILQAPKNLSTSMTSQSLMGKLGNIFGTNAAPAAATPATPNVNINPTAQGFSAWRKTKK